MMVAALSLENLNFYFVIDFAHYYPLQS